MGSARVPAARGAPAAVADAGRAGAERPARPRAHERDRRAPEPGLVPPAALRAGGLVSARRSSADGRDAYYSLDLARCADCSSRPPPRCIPAFASVPSTAPAIEPRPRIGARRGCCSCAPATAPARRWPRRWPAHRAAWPVEAFSAGSHPKPLHPNAVRVMRDRRHRHQPIAVRSTWTSSPASASTG